MNDFNFESESKSGHPPWIKLWVSKYAEFLELETIQEEFQGKELENYLKEMGKVFLNLLYAYDHFGEPKFTIFKIEDRNARMIYKALIRDLKQTFDDYEKRCAANRENGLKGGRPRKEEENPNKPN